MVPQWSVDYEVGRERTFQGEHEQLHYITLATVILRYKAFVSLTCTVVQLVCLLIFAGGIRLDSLFDRLNGAAEEVGVAHACVYTAIRRNYRIGKYSRCAR